MLTIDVDRYRKLPFDVRSEFDEWLRAEKLDNEHAIFLALGEGTASLLRFGQVPTERPVARTVE